VNREGAEVTTAERAFLELGERSGLGALGAEPPAGSRAEALVRTPAFFGFGYPKGGGIFHLTSKFRKLRKPHIFQVTLD